MKKKGILLCIISLFLFMFIAVNDISAKEYESRYISTAYPLNSVTVGELSLTELEFVDNSDSSTLSFGIIGKITNYSKDNLSYKITIKYFDKYQNEVLTTFFQQSLNSRESKRFIRMSDSSDIKQGYKLSDINLYKVIISTTEESSGREEILYYPSKNGDYSDYEYVVDKYDINVKVGLDNILNITENLDVYFNEYKHGIKRNIPLRNEVTRLDGSSDIVRARISNVNVNSKFSNSRNGNDYTITIGDANKYVSGSVFYSIEYDYNLGKDKAKDYDELYINLIGNEWDTAIGNVSFKIEMPKEFDASKLGFSTGYKGSTSSDNILFDVEDNVISGTYHGILESGQALTLRLELPEGYFSEVKYFNSFVDVLFYLIPVISLVICFVLWAIYGKEEEVVKTVEFYPPEELNSLELAYIYKGKAEKEDVASLLIYLASKGYIKIVEDDSGNFVRSNKTKIIELKEYDGNVESERIFMEALFKKADLNKDGLLEIELKDLKYKFAKTIDKILKDINSKSNKKVIFNLNSKLAIFMYILIGISILFTIGFPTIYMSEVLFLLPTLIIILFYIPFWISIFKTRSIAMLLFIIFHQGAFMSALPITSAIIHDSFCRIGVLIGVASIIAMFILAKHIPKRTKYGQEMYGEIEGFKEFLDTCEKQQLHHLTLQNKEYFYDILPYAYVLGISDRWINKFAALGLHEPEWMDVRSDFSVETLDRFVHSTMDSAVTNMSATRSSGGSGGGFSSGGSSGGGSSGGGSGGGGGSSW